MQKLINGSIVFILIKTLLQKDQAFSFTIKQSSSVLPWQWSFYCMTEGLVFITTLLVRTCTWYVRFGVHSLVVTGQLIMNLKWRLCFLHVDYWSLSLGYILTPTFVWYGLNTGSGSQQQLVVSDRYGTCLGLLAILECLLAGNNIERQ